MFCVALEKTCSASAECHVTIEPENVVCRNGACGCKFGTKKDTGKQACRKSEYTKPTVCSCSVAEMCTFRKNVYFHVGPINYTNTNAAKPIIMRLLAGWLARVSTQVQGRPTEPQRSPQSLQCVHTCNYNGALQVLSAHTNAAKVACHLIEKTAQQQRKHYSHTQFTHCMSCGYYYAPLFTIVLCVCSFCLFSQYRFFQ